MQARPHTEANLAAPAHPSEEPEHPEQVTAAGLPTGPLGLHLPRAGTGAVETYFPSTCLDHRVAADWEME